MDRVSAGEEVDDGCTTGMHLVPLANHLKRV